MEVTKLTPNTTRTGYQPEAAKFYYKSGRWRDEQGKYVSRKKVEAAGLVWANESWRLVGQLTEKDSILTVVERGDQGAASSGGSLS